MSNILIIAEHSEGKLKRYSLELAGKAFELARKLGGNAHAVLFGGGSHVLANELGKYGISKVFVAEGDPFKSYVPEHYAVVVRDIATAEKASVILGSATTMGRDLLPKIAAKFKAGFTQDCVAADIAGGKLKVRRPVFAGKALIDLVIKSEVQVATLRPNMFQVVENNIAAQVVQVNAGAVYPKYIVKEIKQVEKGAADVSEADIVVAGGRALASAENFKILFDLEHVLKGAAVGASRAAVDAGYISHDHQVGQTGKTVNPKLYIACGISGAIQHLAGMRTSKVIVAINKDPEAPIFTKADFGVVGDLFKVVPALTEKLKKRL